ncbi:MAG: hypothetical protein Q4C99_03025 [Clostridia bacterium]|nr:hypothetical protein [Clostridia bacterium]
MKRTVTLVLACMVIVSVCVACSSGKSQTAAAVDNNAESKTASVLSEYASDVEKTSSEKTTVTAKNGASTEGKSDSGADNEVEFSKGSAPALSETTSALQNTTLNSDYEKTAQESTVKNNNGGVKESPTKISTDKDGWINKWY